MAENEEPFRRGMVIMAHPDDAEWTCSGTVAKWCAEGWDVVYVLCTDGSKGSSDPEMTSEQLIKIREREQRDAGKVLGLQDVVFLGYPDAYLEPTLELRKDIAREIRRYKPDVVITGSPARDVERDITLAIQIIWRLARPHYRPYFQQPVTVSLFRNS